MIEDPNAATWRAKINVELIPVNKYGDQLTGSTIQYSVCMSGSMVDIITKLETLKTYPNTP